MRVRYFFARNKKFILLTITTHVILTIISCECRHVASMLICHWKTFYKPKTTEIIKIKRAILEILFTSHEKSFPEWIKKWRLRPDECAKFLAQILHVNGCESTAVLEWAFVTWSLSGSFCLNFLSHCLQANGASSIDKWMILCRLSISFCENDFWHPSSSHLKGLSPVCTRSWRSRADATLWVLPQNLHLKPLSTDFDARWL